MMDGQGFRSYYSMFFVNLACTSLLRWGKMEQNERLKATICQLYDVNLMYASVQREFAEEVKHIGQITTLGFS